MSSLLFSPIIQYGLKIYLCYWSYYWIGKLRNWRTNFVFGLVFVIQVGLVSISIGFCQFCWGYRRLKCWCFGCFRSWNICWTGPQITSISVTIVFVFFSFQLLCWSCQYYCLDLWIELELLDLIIETDWLIHSLLDLQNHYLIHPFLFLDLYLNGLDSIYHDYS